MNGLAKRWMSILNTLIVVSRKLQASFKARWLKKALEVVDA